MRGIPGMQVFCPADDARAVRRPARRAGQPGAVLRPLQRAPVGAGSTQPFALGRAEVLARRQRRRDPDVRHAGRRGASRRRDRCARRALGARLLQPAHARAARRGGDAATAVARLPRAGHRRGSLADRRALLRSSPRCWCAAASRSRWCRSPCDGRWFQPGRLADVLEHEGFTAQRLAARFKQALAEHGGARGGARRRRRRR